MLQRLSPVVCTSCRAPLSVDPHEFSSLSSLQRFSGQAIAVPIMDADESVNQTSPGPASSSNKNMCPPSKVDHTTLRISPRMILDIMLERLGIPKAIYRRRMYSQNTMSVTVLFYTSMDSDGTCASQMIITGVRSANEEIAEDSAAVEAARYMEHTTGLVVQDLNYARLQKMQQENGFLKLQLHEAFDMINKLARLCMLAVRYMSSFSNQLQNVMAIGFPPTCGVNRSTHETLVNLQVVAHRIKTRGYRVEKKLYTMRRETPVHQHQMSTHAKHD